MALATRPRPKNHQKKRTAQHHRKTKHYAKAYWPYIPMLAVFAVGLLFNSVLSRGTVLGASQDFSQQILLQETNAARAQQHESRLTIDQQLSAAAQAKAQDMVQHNYWSHNSPSGKTPWSFITSSGYQYQAAGENLAYGFHDAQATIDGWMNSTEHRANILDANYQNVGFGIAQATDYQGHGPQTIVVAEYGQPVSAAAHVTFTVPSTSQNSPASVKGDSTELASKRVSRLQLATGASGWLTVAAAAVAGASMALLATRHGKRLKRAIVQGEHLVMRHPVLDMSLALVIMIGLLVTQTAGVIR